MWRVTFSFSCVAVALLLSRWGTTATMGECYAVLRLQLLKLVDDFLHNHRHDGLCGRGCFLHFLV